MSALHSEARARQPDRAPPLPVETGVGLRSSTAAQRRHGLMLGVAMLLGTALLLPFARVPLDKIPGFVVIYQTAAIGICLLTALLMYGHFTAVRELCLLHLSAGYLYTAAVLSMQLASLKGVFAEDARLFGDSQSTVWLWFFWHLGPALTVLHVALGQHKARLTSADQRRAVLQTVAWLALALAATAALVLVNHAALPVLDLDGDYRRIVTTGIGPGIQLLLACALGVLWKTSGLRKVLHLWLAILLVALFCDNAITMLAQNRANFGWYAGRLDALAGLSVVAVAYLVEMNAAYLTSVQAAGALAESNSRLEGEYQESKRHADELEQADIRKDEFLVMLAHELRNPLAPMSAAAHLLSVGPSDQQLVKETSSMLDRQVAQMGGLVEDLLDAARLSRGVTVLRKVRLDVKQVLAQSMEQAAPLIAEKGHELDTQITSDDAFVLGDHGRLVQVITNLLVNSAKYTPARGKILLKLETTGGEVRVTVTDNGIGMSPELLDRAFILFAQGEPAAERAHGGLGIGLALVKRLVELHGGQVRASSAGAGLGTEMLVVLPRVHHTQRGRALRRTDGSPALAAGD
jgi:signal transduction histidine kinase